MTTAVEAEWDDDTRAWAEGLADHDRAICPGCGLHHLVIHDPDSHLQIVDDYCPACRVLAPYQRKVDDRDRAWEKSNSKAVPGDPRPNDGLHLALRSATPADIRAQRRQQRHQAAQQDGQPEPTRRHKPRLNQRG